MASADDALPVAGQESRKHRGAYFTPQPIATFLSEWAIRLPTDAIFEPSCGEAVFLTAAATRLRALGASAIAADQLQGTDIDSTSVDTATEMLRRRGVTGQLAVGDFFDAVPRRKFDAVIGNPPYVRYQAFAGAARAKGLEAALAQGVRLTALTSSWAPFVVHATSFLDSEGRLALVLPAELLAVNYAAPIRRFLMQRFARVRLILFEERVFPGVLEEVVLLLAEGRGPTASCELHQARNLGSLNAPDWKTWAPDDIGAPWVAGLVPDQAASLYADLTRSDNFSTLSEWGDTYLGMVTGNNRYFSLTADRVREIGLRLNDLMKISPPGSRHLRGLSFTSKAWDQLVRAGARGYLFDPDPGGLSDVASRYIVEGETAGVNTAYKCRMRSPWWRVPRVIVPDAFFTYMNHDAPRIVANRARISFLNSVHGIIFKEGCRQVGMDLLPIAVLNTATLLGAELVGRAYGGGLLKLEPKEAGRLPVPSFDAVCAAATDLRHLRPTLAKHLREGNLADVVTAVDKVLLRRSLKIRRDHINHLRAARRALFERRITRSQG